MCPSFYITISGQLSKIPCRLKRHLASARRQKKSVLVTGITVESIGVGNYYGFEVSGDHLFLLGDFTVTHNSTLLDRLKTLYDDEVERVVFVDAPTMTKAGLEKWLLDKAEKKTLPEILVMEEIEKCDKDNLLVLGSIMASGYIMRTNAIIGRKQEPARFLIMATCNDEQTIKEFRRGFIWDRFVNQIPCTLPDETTMHKILLDKIAKIPGGKPEWAQRVMELAAKMSVRRPRKIIGFLAGRTRLERGTYQRDQLSIAEAGRLEQASLERR